MFMAQNMSFADNILKLVEIYSRSFIHSQILIMFFLNLQALLENSNVFV